MSDADQESTANTVSSPSALRSGVDWVAKHWPRVRLSHEGVMLERVQRVQRIGEISARNAMTGKLDDMNGWPGSEEGDKMGVKIGDEVHHHYASNKASLLAKAALLGLGAGAVTGVLWLDVNFYREQPVIELPAAADTDTTRRIEIEVWRSPKVATPVDNETR